MKRRDYWWRRSIAAQIIVLFLGMLLAVQAISFTALRTSLSDHAHRVLPTSLHNGERLLQTLLDRNAQRLIHGARLVAADYGFREALSSNDSETITSVLANHGARIGATDAALLGTDFRLRSSTSGRPQDISLVAYQLATLAAKSGQASAITLLAGRPYEAVLVPVKAPVTVGWVLMAFPLDEKLVVDLKGIASIDLTLLSRAQPSDPWSVGLSSLDFGHAMELARADWEVEVRNTSMTSLSVTGEEIGVQAKLLSAEHGPGPNPTVLALLSLSIDDAVRLPQDLQYALIAITLIAIAIFAVGSILTARHVTAPLRRLADAAENVGLGEYASVMPDTARNDEIGDLSQSFEQMRKSVAENQARILKLAYWDDLTGLPNRARFRDAVHDAIRSATADEMVSVIMLDLNEFKRVNDVLGYRVGDLLLVHVAERLTQQIVRTGDIVARLSGDEFGLLLCSSDAKHSLSVAQRIEKSFDSPLTLEGHRVDVGAGIGFACWPQHASEGDGLLNRAEIAMYAAKLRKDGPLMYDSSIDVASAQSLSLMTELRQAVERNELRLHLQPKLALDSGQIVGAEALVRWQHPQRGLLAPVHFVPFAEQTGFIRILTMWVFGEALLASKSLCNDGIDVLLSVNLSTRDLIDPDLPQKFSERLGQYGASATRICLEITETAIMDNPQRALLTLDRLSALGFKLSIDDYGSGYSSLAYLKRLPVNELKIDQSFIRSMHSDPDDAMIVQSTIDLAHNLGITVVAEGVETVAIWDMLYQFKCDEAQGYYMGRPMPISEFPGWAAIWRARYPDNSANRLRNAAVGAPASVAHRNPPQESL
jgi:diguanylate cyclase (GGDEF)-like protein